MAWTVFAFGGIYPATLIVPAIICAAMALAYSPPILRNSHTPHVDLWSLVAIGAMVLQLIPLPRAILRGIDPAADRIAHAVLLVDRGGPLPISIDVVRSAAALAALAAVFLLFVTTRYILERGGVRTVTRIIAVIGLVLSAVAIAQSATGHGLMYWIWKPVDEGPDPFGPFVNRNHFATWAVMAIPLLAGYLTAHTIAHRNRDSAPPRWQHRIGAALDARAWMLLASTTMLIVGLAASLSRSGLLGFAGALVCGAVFATTGGRPAYHHAYARRAGAALAALAILAVATQVGPVALADRFGTSREAMADRFTIWHDTLPVLADFWLTGTGAGTYLRSMAVYQRSKPGVIFNQAHNHYLQVAAEGGVLVGLPVFFALCALARAIVVKVRADRSGIYWIRAGAAAGLFGVAVQSVWETGLTIPANAALAAVLAAIAIHVPVRGGERD